MMTKKIALVAGSALIIGALAFSSPAVAQKLTPAQWMESMHESPAMERMHDQMPAGLQEQCDQMHDRVTQWMDQHPGQFPPGMGGMMGGSTTGSGMMGGSGGMMSY